jgi:exodeoxyribonuclease-3
LRWFERLTGYAAELLELSVPVVLAGDHNVLPTELDVYKPECWVDNALFRQEVRIVFENLVTQDWIDALRTMHPNWGAIRKISDIPGNVQHLSFKSQEYSM